MAYIGKSPTGTGVRSRYYYTATGGETSLSGADDNSNTLVFSDGNYVDVSLNGIVLVAGTDYNTSTANTIAGLSALSASDIVEVVVYDIFTVADTVSAKDGGTFSGNVVFNGNTTGLDLNGTEMVLDADGDTSITADTDDQIDFKTGGSDRVTIDASGNVGIGTSSPSEAIDVYRSGTGSAFIGLDNAQVGAAAVFGKQGSTAYGATGVGEAAVYTYDNSISIMADGGASNTASIKFSTGGNTERMRIDQYGNFLKGTTGYQTTGPATQAAVEGQLLVSNKNGLVVIGGDGAGGFEPVALTRKADNGSLITFWHDYDVASRSGDITVTSSSVAYNTSSDYRLKENVTATWDATTRLKQLNPVRFNFIADADTTVDGFLAHEVQSVVPEAITGTHDEVDDDGNPVYQGIDQSKLVPLLVKTIQELEARITALENVE